MNLVSSLPFTPTATLFVAMMAIATLRATFVGLGECVRVLNRFPAFGIDLGDLLGNETVVAQHPLDVPTPEHRQINTFCSSHRSKRRCQALADPLVVQMNAMQSQNALDPRDDPGSLVHEVFALAAEPLGILFLDTLDAHRAGHAVIVGKPSSQRPAHTFGVEPIGLGHAPATRTQKACRIGDDRRDAARNQRPGDPEPVVSASWHTVTENERDSRRSALNPEPVQKCLQPIDVPGGHGVDARIVRARRQEGANPGRFAQLKRNTADIVDLVVHCRHTRSLLRSHQFDEGGTFVCQPASKDLLQPAPPHSAFAGRTSDGVYCYGGNDGATGAVRTNKIHVSQAAKLSRKADSPPDAAGQCHPV